MNDDINCPIYYLDIMENFIDKLFGNRLFGNKQPPEPDPLKPKYIKHDGTRVIEQYSDIGKVVHEINKPAGLLISRYYIGENILFADYARKKNLEIGHRYDQYEQMVYEFNSLYDEHNVLAKKIEIYYEYHGNGIRSKEFTIITPGDVKTEIQYDENGKRTAKIEIRGAVKTWFDENDKPYKREIDRGSGGIIKEDL